MSGQMHNSPKVEVVYTHHESAADRTGFTATFEIGWTHTDGHDKFRTELVALLDALHATQAKWHGHRAVVENDQPDSIDLLLNAEARRISEQGGV